MNIMRIRVGFGRAGTGYREFGERRERQKEQLRLEACSNLRGRWGAFKNSLRRAGHSTPADFGRSLGDARVLSLTSRYIRVQRPLRGASELEHRQTHTEDGQTGLHTSARVTLSYKSPPTFSLQLEPETQSSCFSPFSLRPHMDLVPSAILGGWHLTAWRTE